MSKHRKCGCDTCKQGLIFRKIRELLGDNLELQEGLNKIQNDLVHTEIDLEYMTSLVNGTWPDAEEHMLSRGWVRKPKDLCLTCTHTYESYSVKGELLSSGKCIITGYRGSFIKILTSDGEVFEVGNDNVFYPKDKLEKIVKD